MDAKAREELPEEAQERIRLTEEKLAVEAMSEEAQRFVRASLEAWECLDEKDRHVPTKL